MVESRTVYSNFWRVINLVQILLILAHWFGCFYYLLSEAEGFKGDWVCQYKPGDYATLTRNYLGSLYWSTLPLTTIGDLPTPETNAEESGQRHSEQKRKPIRVGRCQAVHATSQGAELHEKRVLRWSSLSREDLAMQDYPEAQDILQTLGRKRRMEARNAKYKIVAYRIKSRAEAAENCTGIVEKNRCNVKGLQNAFSKGHQGTRPYKN
ncbi:hypothetical protein ACI65C_003234 [Semiaphis heraclei]